MKYIYHGNCCATFNTIMFLSHLPIEILDTIASFLPRSSIAQLCLVNRQVYAKCLPVLYACLELSFRSHIEYIVNDPHAFLRHVLEHHTRHLHLVCRQTGSHSMIANLAKWLPNIHTLTFSDYHVLPADHLIDLLQLFPRINTLQFRCCHLQYSSSDINAKIKGTLASVDSLNLVWTDFSDDAITLLLGNMPNLVRVHFGTNHNRNRSANNNALLALERYCLGIHSLNISLQHVQEDIICRLIVSYGHQLRHLSIPCDSPRILTIIAANALQLKQLIIRAEALREQFTPFEVTRRRQPTNVNNTVAANGLSDAKLGMIHILRQCQTLVYLEMTSWMVRDIPYEVWQIVRPQQDTSGMNVNSNYEAYYLDDRAWRHRRGLKQHDVGYLTKTLALHMRELYEIRKRLRR